MADWNTPIKSPHVFLLLGGTLITLALLWTCIGKASVRSSWVYRTKEPLMFWLLVGMYGLGGLLFIGVFLLS
jgi:hypothetical protein